MTGALSCKSSKFNGFLTICSKITSSDYCELYVEKTACSSLWDTFQASVHRLARASCCYRQLSASGSIQNDFKWHAKLILGVAADILAQIWLYTTRFILPVVPDWPETSLKL
eukprot:6209223-Pleurochrysis_carterae.AAC.12